MKDLAPNASKMAFKDLVRASIWLPTPQKAMTTQQPSLVVTGRAPEHKFYVMCAQETSMC